jgi:hypothetical protein
MKMSKLYDLQELVANTGLPERTVRYYLAKVLEAPGGTRGRKAFYTQETLDQLKLAKQILLGPYDPKRGEVKPSLRDFRHWLKSHTADEISSMAELNYRIKPKKLLAASLPQTNKEKSPPLEQRFVEEQSTDYSASISQSYGKEDMQNTSDSAAQYLDRVMGTKQGEHSDQAGRSAQDTQWRSIRFGDDLEIRTRKQLTPAQHKQLALAGQLLQSMFEKA